MSFHVFNLKEIVYKWHRTTVTVNEILTEGKESMSCTMETLIFNGSHKLEYASNK